MDPQDLIHQGIIGLVVAHGIQRLKCSDRFQWIGTHTPQIVAGLSHLIAFVTAIGFTVSHTGSLVDGGSLTISWESAGTISTLVERYVVSWAAQKGTYRGLIKETPALQTLINPVYHQRPAATYPPGPSLDVPSLLMKEPDA